LVLQAGIGRRDALAGARRKSIGFAAAVKRHEQPAERVDGHIQAEEPIEQRREEIGIALPGEAMLVKREIDLHAALGRAAKDHFLEAAPQLHDALKRPLQRAVALCILRRLEVIDLQELLET